MHIQDIMIRLLLKQPFYGYVAASVSTVESRLVKKAGITAEPHLKLHYNREWFDTLDELQATGAVMHELLHLVMLHPFRMGGRDRDLWSVACDMAVNEFLDTAFLAADSITVEKVIEETKLKLPHKMSAEYYYEVISGEDASLNLIFNENETSLLMKNGQELKASNFIEGEMQETDSRAMESMLFGLLDQAASEGEVPNGLKPAISELYKPYEVNWRNVLKRFMTGKGKVNKRKSCKKESKRFENLPGVKRTVGVNVLLALDESGSISNDQIIKFYGELRAIKRITGASISVTQFDTDCTDPVPVEYFTRKMERARSGGTDFRPVFQMAEKLRIPLLVIFTDGDGTAPETTGLKVLWVLTEGGVKPAPYGHSIVFKE